MKYALCFSLLALALPALAQNPPNPSDTAQPAPHVRFVDADADHDGRLSRTEAEAMPFVSRHFDAIDTNHDGYISRDELRAAHERMQAMRAARRQQSGGSNNPADPDTAGTN